MKIKAVLLSLGLVAALSVSSVSAAALSQPCNQATNPSTCDSGLVCQMNAPDHPELGSICVVQNGYAFHCTSNDQCTVPFNTLPVACQAPQGAPAGSLMMCVVVPTAGSQGAPCTSQEQCNLAADEVCINGFCNGGAIASMSGMGGMSGMFGGSTGGMFPGGGGMLPSLNCMVDGKSICTDEQQCFFGVCIQPRPTVSCPGLTGQGCNIANGEMCNGFTGLCVPGGAPQCEYCGAGVCLPPPFPNSQMEPTCLNSTGQATCGSGGAACIGDSRCFMGFCRPCGELCGLGDLLNNMFAAGQMPADFQVRNATQILAGLAGDGGVLRPQPGEIMQLNGELAGQLQRLNMGQAGGTSQLANGATLNIPQIVGGALNNQFLMQAGATLTSAVQILADASLTFSLANGARARFSALNLSAPLNANGGSNAFFEFPSMDGQTESHGNGVVQASGGINLQGFAGATKISISGAADAIRDAAIGTGATLYSAGAILGQTSRLLVTGTLQMTGTILEPLLSLQDGARAIIRSNSAGFNGGNLTFASGAGARAELHINATAGAGNGGDNVVFRTIQTCPGTATIVLNVLGSATELLKTGLTVFNYGVETASFVSGFQCSVKVCGNDGCVVAVNPNAPAGRRLLATSTSSSFGNTKLTVKSESSAAAAGVRASIAAVAAVLAGAFAVLSL